jgi:pilus assembly protein CpaB
LKRSNRLILLIGVFLAIVTFVGIVLLLGRPSGPGGGGQQQQPTELPTVFAERDIPLGTAITAEMLRTENRPVTTRDPTAFGDVSLLLGKIARTNIAQDKQLTASDFATTGAPTTIDTPAGQRAIAVQVDQVSGVGTLIRTGDYVDLVGAVTGAGNIPLRVPESLTPLSPSLYNPTTAKVVLQGIQVIGTLLPPAPAQQGQQGEQPQGEPGTALTGQQEIVILSVNAQQAEIIKWLQLSGSVSLALRSPVDFRDPETQEVIVPPPAETTGITLFRMVEDYDVLVPELVDAILPDDVDAGTVTP